MMDESTKDGVVIPADVVFRQTMGEAELALSDRLAAEFLADIEALKTIRKARGQTQKQVAEALGTSQAAVARLEGRSDHRLSTLRSYTRALGGHLSLSVTFGDGTVLDLTGSPVSEARPEESGRKRSVTPA